MAESSDARDLLLNRLADEFAALHRGGGRPRVEDYCDRHPELAADIRSLFPALVELERAKADAGPELAVGAAGDPPVTRLGDFHVLREVGRGGMGVVYEAEQVSLGRRVALKILPATIFRDPLKRRRFEREAKAAAKLHHTNIVPVYGFGEHDGTPYYVMQFIPGLGLDAVIDELGRSPGDDRTGSDRPPAGRSALSAALVRSLVAGDGAATFPCGRAAELAARTVTAGGGTPGPGPPAVTDRGPSASLSASSVHLPGQAGSGADGSAARRNNYRQSVARIGVQVAGALAHAHKSGVLHRDIKPGNLLLDLDGVVWVTDFGLAKADDSDDLTHTGDLLGTLRYMPPEAFEGKSDARSDVYSLGLTLYEMVALRPAYEERDRNRLVKQVTTGDLPRLRKLRRDAPRDLVTVIEKATAKDPARRYQAAGALADDLQRFLDGRPIAARRATEVERLWMWARRRPAMAGMAAALLLCLLAGSVVSAVFAVRAERFARDAELREKEAKEQRDRADRERAAARREQARAEAGEREATGHRRRADRAAEETRQNLYYAQMHLALQAWREHRGLPYMRELLANWVPPEGSPDRRGWEWFYVNSLPYQNLRTLEEGGDGRGPCTVAWHVGSRRLAAGTADGLIRVWDPDREQPTLTLKGPAPAITYFGMRWLAWSPDGGRLAAGGKDGSVHVWETGSGKKLRILHGHRSPVQAVAFGSDGTRLAAWGQAGAIKIWDPDTGRSFEDVTHPGAVVTAGAWSPDDKSLATGHFDGTVTLSAARAGAEPVRLRAHVDWIYHLAWSPDSTRLASTSANDFFVSVWDAATREKVLGPLRHSHGITTIEWEPGGRRLATGSIDETVKVWDATTGHGDVTLRGQGASPVSLAWGPDGRLAVGGQDGSLRVWGSVRDQESDALPGHAGRATAAAWSPDGRRLASAGDDGTVRVWDPAARKEVLALPGHDRARTVPQFGLVRSLAWNPAGTLLASAGLDGAARVWDVTAGREVFALPTDRGAVWAVAWSPDGTRLAAGSQDGTVRLVEGLGRTPTVRSFQAHERGGRDATRREGVRALAWSPDGDRLASAGWDGLVKLWDPARSAEVARMTGHRGWALAVGWSPDGAQVASAGSDRLVITWDAKTGRRLQTMRGHGDFVDAVGWSPDGTRLASASIDNSVRVWDPRTGAEAFALRGGSAMFHDLSWHPHGAQLAAACSDGRVWLWDATRGFERDTTPRALPYVERAVASGSARGEERLWCAEALLRAGKPGEAVLAAGDAPRALCKLARRFDGQGNAFLADTARRKARALLEGKRAQEPGNPEWAGELAQLLVDSGRTREAVPHLAAQWAADPGDTIFALKVAALQAWFGQDKGLAATRQQLLAVARGTADAGTAERVVKACSILPSADPAEREALLALARKGVKMHRGEWTLLSLGMAEYRCGNYAAADQALLAAAEAGRNSARVKGIGAFYRAMSLVRLGKPDEARRLAAEAAATMRPLPADGGNPLAGGVHYDEVILWLASKEANAVIGSQAAPAGPAPAPPGEGR